MSFIIFITTQLGRRWKKPNLREMEEFAKGHMVSGGAGILVEMGLTRDQGQLPAGRVGMHWPAWMPGAGLCRGRGPNQKMEGKHRS